MQTRITKALQGNIDVDIKELIVDLANAVEILKKQDHDFRNETQVVLYEAEQRSEKAYERGLVDGATKRAILELQGRDKFLEDLKKETP